MDRRLTRSAARSSLLFAVLLVLPACAGQDAPGREPTSAPQPEVSAEPPVARSQPPVAPPATAVDPCDAHRAAFRAAMATATGTCAVNSDCGCFNPVVGEAGCGGITDSVTTSELGAIEARFHADACPWPHQCGPWACQPECHEGRCRNSTRGGRIVP